MNEFFRKFNCVYNYSEVLCLRELFFKKLTCDVLFLCIILHLNRLLNYFSWDTLFQCYFDTAKSTLDHAPLFERSL